MTKKYQEGGYAVPELGERGTKQTQKFLMDFLLKSILPEEQPKGYEDISKNLMSLLPFGVGGALGAGEKGANVIQKILSRNAKALKNLNGHHAIDKLIKNEHYKELLKLNPGSKLTREGIKLPDAKSVTPQSGGGIMGMLKKILPWGMLGTTGDTQE